VAKWKSTRQLTCLLAVGGPANVYYITEHHCSPDIHMWECSTIGPDRVVPIRMPKGWAVGDYLNQVVMIQMTHHQITIEGGRYNVWRFV
jgi:hypothetical protein